MKNVSRSLILLLTLFLTLPLFSQEISPAVLRQDVKILAADSLGGRKSGTVECQLAALYLVNRYQEIGLQEINHDYFQRFEVVYEVKLGKRNSLSFDDIQAELENDYIPYSFSSNGIFQGDVVFAGYGFEIHNDSIDWDDYEGIDVKGKWVMMLRGNPEPENSKSKFVDYSEERGKVLLAKDKGAMGVIFVSGVQMEKTDTIVSLFFDKSSSTAGIAVINVKRSVADKMLASQGKTLEALEELLNKTQKPSSFQMNTTVSCTVQISQIKGLTENVVGLLEGSHPVLKNEYIVIGAHFDHLGMGGPSSGSRMPDTLAVHNGADDNASGVAGMLSLASKFSESPVKPARSMLFVAFSGEEMGLLGSKYFVNNSPVSISSIKAMFNFDMIGRLGEDSASLMIGGSGTAAESEDLLNTYAKNRNFSLKFSPEGYGASDHSSFYGENIPVFFFTTGAHDDYHTPYDDADKINYSGVKEVLDYTYDVILDVANKDKALTFTEAGPKNPGSGRGTRFKVTLGIIPDFASSGDDGLRVDGLRKDGPASKGGMLKGDVITAINGNPVKNIYEYMARLKELEAGKTISVDVIRAGKKVVLIFPL